MHILTRGRDLAKLCAALKEISQYFTDIEDDIANKGASITLANRAHFMALMFSQP